MIKAIIFDCFGVLVGQGFDETYRLAGGDPVADKDFIDDLLHMANMGMITAQEMNQQVIDKLAITTEDWERTIAAAERPHEDLLAYIGELKKSYKIAVLSNANVGTLQRKFLPDQLELFDAIVVSAEVNMVKPQPEIYTYTAERLGVEPNECVFTDDIAVYCEGARAVGMQTIQYGNFAQFKADLEQILNHT